MNTLIYRHFFRLALAIGLVFLSSCSWIIDSQVNKAMEQLSDSLLNYEDPETVSSAMPTFLLIADAFAAGEDASTDSLLSAAQVYGAYVGAFVSDQERQKTLSKKALTYAHRGACQADDKWCDIREMKNPAFEGFVAELDQNDVEIAYAYASAWLSYIQSHSDDWGVIADLNKATALLEIIVKYDEDYDNAGAHLYLGAIATTLPPAMGGKPEEGKTHFERALELTNDKHLLVKVEYARRYARLVFKKELHHQLLTEVIEADPTAPQLTLMNTWAQQEAKKLLASEDEYFD